MNIENNETMLSPRKQPPTAYTPSVAYQSPRRDAQPTNFVAKANQETSYARGGNGIFGDPIVSVLSSGSCRCDLSL